MKKWIAILLLMLTFLIYWIVEPYSLNPFSQAQQPDSKFRNQIHCQSQSALNVLESAILKAELLGGGAGFYSQQCGGLASAFGYKDKGNLAEFEIDTVTRIASISKPMTAIAIMQLKELGRLSLDDKLVTHLPSVPSSHENITLRQLLNHTSGVPHYSSKLDALSFTHYQSLQNSAEFIFDKGLRFEPGQQYLYSSYGYTLLGRVIETISGTSFEDYMRQHIWLPSGMENTQLESEHPKVNKSRLYLNLAGNYIRSPYTDLSIIAPGGGVESTAADLLLFGRAILENRLISSKSLEEMIDVTQSLSPTVGDDPYGLGWYVYHHQELGRIISHSGSQPGASGFFQILLDKKVMSFGLANSYGSKNRVRQLAYDFADIALGY